MSEARPRMPTGWVVGEPLLCSFPTCDGSVGRLVIGTVPSRLPFRGQPHAATLQLRALIEAQAPPDAYAYATWVVPEGFVLDPRGETWCLSKRGKDRQSAARRQAPPHRALHDALVVGDEPLYAPVIPLPARVQCPSPGCARVHIVDEPYLQELIHTVIASLMTLALQVRDDESAGDRWLARRLGLPDEAVTLLRDHEPLEERQRFLAQLAYAIPESALFAAAYLTARPPRVSDVFVPRLEAPLMVQQVDAHHERDLRAATPVLLGHGPDRPNRRSR